MRPDLETILARSRTYQGLSRLRQWSEHSTVGCLLTDERTLVGVVALVLTVSLIRVLTSTMAAPVKFLSFALLFVVVAALTWRYTEPLVKS